MSPSLMPRTRAKDWLGAARHSPPRHRRTYQSAATDTAPNRSGLPGATRVGRPVRTGPPIALHPCLHSHHKHLSTLGVRHVVTQPSDTRYARGDWRGGPPRIASYSARPTSSPSFTGRSPAAVERASVLRASLTAQGLPPCTIGTLELNGAKGPWAAALIHLALRSSSPSLATQTTTPVWAATTYQTTSWCIPCTRHSSASAGAWPQRQPVHSHGYYRLGTWLLMCQCGVWMRPPAFADPERKGWADSSAQHCTNRFSAGVISCNLVRLPPRYSFRADRAVNGPVECFHGCQFRIACA
jgi:hypothetical protein